MISRGYGARMGDGKVPDQVREWVQRIADQRYGGDWGEAASAILTAAFEQEQQPGNPWAYLEARQQTGQAGHVIRPSGQAGGGGGEPSAM